MYAVVSAIPPGRVLTYGAVATLAGRPNNARMVGRLMAGAGAGIPAHRVVNASGRIAPGWPEQRTLLEREGVGFRESGRVDLARFMFRR